MENKWSVMMMMFVLVVMAAIGGEANLSCERKCEHDCDGSVLSTLCLKRCLVQRCRHHPPTRTFPSTSSSPMMTRGMEEMRG
ncbi:hypothetical protein ISN45_Aa08g027240 [Arabidopsis thaliana x Arabidopsis arenosa]|uniref:Plant thionin family protein n=1 Tax=Arabidopsis thaliana x Arabidopsis arenosa TaxID=1240361 RepID=A0A8T1XLT0_9BRAS|nr:hypothetical protein ISN45_Aa08g027240 [Arabidopsis thaliana x Arabidopsis arenosa]